VIATVQVRGAPQCKKAVSEIIALWVQLFLQVQLHLPISGCKTLFCNWIFLWDHNKNYVSLFTLGASGLGNKQCLKV